MYMYVNAGSSQLCYFDAECEGETLHAVTRDDCCSQGGRSFFDTVNCTTTVSIECDRGMLNAQCIVFLFSCAIFICMV